MPTPYVEKMAKKYNITIDESEKLWNEAKAITKKKRNLPNNESKWTEDDWKYTTGVYKHLLENKYNTSKESIYNPIDDW